MNFTSTSNYFPSMERNPGKIPLQFTNFGNQSSLCCNGDGSCNGIGPPLPPRSTNGSSGRIPHSKSRDAALNPLDLLSPQGIDPMLLAQLRHLNRRLQLQHQLREQQQQQQLLLQHHRVQTIPIPHKRNQMNLLSNFSSTSNTAQRCLPLDNIVPGPSSLNFKCAPRPNSVKLNTTSVKPKPLPLPKVAPPQFVPMPLNASPPSTPNGRQVPIEDHVYRKPAMIVSIIDAVFATSLLVFHGLTLMVQEMPNENITEGNGLLPRVPMTPGKLTITGYMEVIAWIGILGVNFTQLLVAVGLFNGCEKDSEVLKAFESSRVYMKTSAFVLIILAIKLCILYFMHQMNMLAVWTAVFTSVETIFHIAGMFIVFRFFLEIKTNYPMITEIYLTPPDDGSPKTNPVSDAVWF